MNPAGITHLFSHEVDGILFKDVRVELAQLSVALSGSLKGLLSRVLQEEVLELLRFTDPVRQLLKLDLIAVILVNLLEDVIRVLSYIFPLRHRETHQFAKTLNSISQQHEKLFPLDHP